MQPKARLSEIIDAMDMQMEETCAYLDRTSGKILLVMDDDMRLAEEDADLDDCPAWQREAIQEARRVLEADEDELMPLPSKFDIHDYSIIESFCRSIEDPGTSEALWRAIKGKGAFRRFKHVVHGFGIADDWHRHRDEAYRRIAIEWCEAHDIAYAED